MKRRPTAMVRVAVLAGAVMLSLSSCTGSNTPESDPYDLDTVDLEVAVSTGERLGSNGFIVPAACIAGVTWKNTFYTIRSEAPRNMQDPRPAGYLEGVVVPGCNDSGNLEADTRVNAWTIEGVDPERAILVEYP
jgi:hypothetical protein